MGRTFGAAGLWTWCWGKDDQVTLAICIKCGHRKIGALTLCHHCKFIPLQPDDQARSVYLSDHNLSATKLEGVAEKLRLGEPVLFDEKWLQESAKHGSVAEPRYLLGIRVTSWGALGIAVVLGILIGSIFMLIFRVAGL
jgi:hypothetical protein